MWPDQLSSYKVILIPKLLKNLPIKILLILSLPEDITISKG